MRNRTVLALGSCLITLAFITGCATTKGPSDPEVIQKTMTDWSEALVAKDIDKVMTYYSNDYQNAEWGDKAGMENFFKNEALPQQYLDGLTISLEKAQIAVKGDTADLSPIDITGNFGGMSLKAALKKEKGTWKIIATEQM